MQSIEAKARTLPPSGRKHGPRKRYKQTPLPKKGKEVQEDRIGMERATPRTARDTSKSIATKDTLSKRKARRYL